ncbi:diguanylate cyclase [Devosia salina]|uniref:Diguanylate cyclase n=1 Tax=Devosia salina TaxID=2860336 RepID=A0ABX8WK23_9HYPH|nr:diguanylate cyclase [Devosia salina]QYO78364.1 diguanylate cyclase [Devosia salina]
MCSSSPHTLDFDAFVHGVTRARLGVWDWDLVTGDCVYSDSWYAMLGYASGELQPSSELWLELTHPDDRQRAIESGERHLRGETTEIETELRLKRKDGTWLWALDRGGIIERDELGRPTRMIGVQTDITKQKAAELDLERANERFRLALDASDVGVWEVDFATETSYWDSRTREIFGLGGDGESQPLNSWHAYLHPDDKASTEHAHENVGLETQVIRYRIVLPSAQIRHVETFAKLVPVPNGANRVIGTIRDVTVETDQRAALQWAADHDGLTGLLNRTAFKQRLRVSLAAAGANPVCVLIIDLDHFKAINDQGGHAAGDRALCQTANVLRWAVEGEDVARLGGDEFAAIVQGSVQEAETLANGIRRSIEGFGTDTKLSASIGVAGSSPTNRSASALIKSADLACYQAKRSGRNRVATAEGAVLRAEGQS